MPQLDWDVFSALPGSVEGNFERLCRALMRWHFGQFGTFAEQAMQPGVEFHLNLNAHCHLGAAGRWWGWQCRWYGLAGGVALGANRRAKIEQALRTTEQILPGVTDWALWTRRPLTAGDQRWFYGLQTQLQLHLWTSDDVEHYLSGPATILRSTYFGELVATPNVLEELHARAVAPISRRWIPEVHQKSNAERVINRVLGRESEWRRATRTSQRISQEASALAQGVPADLAVACEALIRQASDVATTLHTTVADFSSGDLERLRARLNSMPAELGSEALRLPQLLRSRRHPGSLVATNLVDSVRRAHLFLRESRDALDKRLLAIVAGAGVGKTHLSVRLTRAEGAIPAGVLLHGRDLPAGGTLDDLARRVVINGAPVASVEALVAAVDAAGQRANRRLAIVIDGLNESEDPRDWRAPLASLAVTLERFRNVVVVCTVRPGFVVDALPPDMVRVRLQGFPARPSDAIRAYFAHYKIDAVDVALPLRLLRHPLTLRLFCEVANPSRAKTVGAEAMPASLTALFDRYLHQVAKRVSQLTPRAMRYLEPDVLEALTSIAGALWAQQVRSLSVAQVRTLIGDSSRPWSVSLLRALEEEGVLIRVRGQGLDTNHVAFVYDLLAGHVIASAEIARIGRAGVRSWLGDPATLEAFRGDSAGRALGQDVYRALVGLLPHRIHGEQLWPLVPPPLQERALIAAARLEGQFLDAATVEALQQLGASGGAYARQLFEWLWQTRASAAHPLNAFFLDATIRPLSTSARDLNWTEWVRDHEEDLREDAVFWARRWRIRLSRAAGDELCARSFMWLLTSTVRDLRDEATRALYWFGRRDPGALFHLAVDSLQISDVYVAERVIAAAYGVAMAHQITDSTFKAELRTLLSDLSLALLGPEAKTPTNHWLLREYVVGIFAFASRYYPEALPDNRVVSHATFCAAPAPVGPSDVAEREEAHETLGMDFENYTLGRLVSGRRNYDMGHTGHLEVVRHVEDTVWELGWRRVPFEAVEAGMNRAGGSRERPRTERYGKKYGWIGFFSYAGILAQRGELPSDGGRLSDVDIDPSFPAPPAKLPLTMPSWGGDRKAADQEWMASGAPPVPLELLRLKRLGTLEGPWLAVYAQLTWSEGPRSVWGHLLALAQLPPASLVSADFASCMAVGEWDISSPYDLPSDHYVFAGEIPWHEGFSRVDVGASSASNYIGRLRAGPHSLRAECFAHWYGWEPYHSTTNRAGGSLVPSRPFSEQFDLRSVPRRLHQVLPDGSPAALTVQAPDGFSGDILYLKEDLLLEYTGGRPLAWRMRGERQLIGPAFDRTPWLEKMYLERSHEFGLSWSLEDAMQANGKKRRSRR